MTTRSFLPGGGINWFLRVFSRNFFFGGRVPEQKFGFFEIFLDMVDYQASLIKGGGHLQVFFFCRIYLGWVPSRGIVESKFLL